MSEIERLKAQVTQLKYEKQQLTRFKHINQMMLDGLDAMLISESHEEVFERLFDVIGNVLGSEGVIILHHNENDCIVSLVTSSMPLPANLITIPYTDVSGLFTQTVNLRNVSQVEWWKTHFSTHFGQYRSVLTHPVKTSLSSYVWMVVSRNNGAFSKQLEEILVSFSSFVANTMSQFEARNAVIEREALLQKQQRIEKSMVKQEKMASLGQLTAGVAHELNNPLGFINSNLYSLQEYIRLIDNFTVQARATSEELANAYHDAELDFVISDTNDLIDESLNGIQRACDIIYNLKAFSHPDDKTISRLNYADVLHKAFSIIRTQAKGSAELEIVIEYEEQWVLGNATQLAQVLINLISNAIQAVKISEGKIQVHSWVNDNVVHTTVTDNGAGIAETSVEHIFEPFYTTKDVGQGTGLGLSISRALIEQHNGELKLDYTNSGGTQFHFLIPVEDYL